MLFNFNNLSAHQKYHLITQTITPRPIAWILTKNASGNTNLAPFSYFNALGSDPALLVVSIGNKSETVGKDTKVNLLREKECILHIPSETLAEAVNSSAATLPYGESELAQHSLELIDFTESLPRVKDAKVALHCRLYDVHSLGESSFEAFYLEVLSLYADDDMITQEGKHTFIDSDILKPLGRLGGNDFAAFGGKLTIKRPS
ncbi:flavin reductase family protein [Marinomonas sp. 2405UD68-3]|uniref:flavin reductase family protein n=1 Tax=Marinomonas sp. 2405UD68-3 TaxID=3391835 RepID=UPI0039C9CC63